MGSNGMGLKWDGMECDMMECDLMRCNGTSAYEEELRVGFVLLCPCSGKVQEVENVVNEP